MINHSVCPWYYINGFSYLTGLCVGLGVYWFTCGKKQYDDAIDREVERRLQLRLSQQQTPKPSTQQSTANIKQLETKLIGLLQGDRAAAMRLVQSVKSKNPNQSAQWCWEKAIEDLERDRF